MEIKVAPEFKFMFFSSETLSRKEFLYCILSLRRERKIRPTFEESEKKETFKNLGDQGRNRHAFSKEIKSREG